MEAAVFQGSVTLVVAVALAVYVLTRPDRSFRRPLLLGLVGGAALWSAGMLLGRLAPWPAATRLGPAVSLVGASLVPPLWLALAARQARVALATRHLGAVTLALLVPSALVLLARLTNPTHPLFFAVEITPGRSPAQLIAAAGPGFWGFVTWSQLCGLAGAFLLLASARRIRSPHRRRPALLLAAAPVLPLATSALFLGQLLPAGFDPTPLALTLAMLMGTASIYRLGLLDTAVPLARREVLEHLADGLLMADDEGIVLDFNAAATRILGRSDLRGRSLAAALCLVEWDTDREQIEREIAGRDGRSTETLVLRDRNGRWIELRGALVRGRSGEPVGRYVVLHDRTEHRRWERFVQQSQKLETVGGMVAGIAHEVNNPLAYVRSNLNALQGMAVTVTKHLDAFEEDERESLLEMCDIVGETLDGVERIGRIVSGLRRFSRADADEELPVDLNAVARQAIRLAGLGSQTGVIVTARLAETLPAVKGSADRLAQVVLNLLLNARQAVEGRPFGRIVVETLAQCGGVELHVSDNGPGIPDEIQDRIFDPFFTTKAPDQGTGLGLSIAFDIVRDHGGSLEIASRPGEGARFIVRLPST